MTNKKNTIRSMFYGLLGPENGRLINGRRYHEVKGVKFILRSQNYRAHLADIKMRLEAGPGFFLEQDFSTSDQELAKARAFALIRMVMPSIETLARALSMSVGTLLSELNVPAPNLIWNLYRDSLAHNDNWIKAKIGSKEVEPLIWISMGPSRGLNFHQVNPERGTHALNVGVLYYDLLEYIQNEIDRAPKDGVVEVIRGVEYLDNSGNFAVQQIIDEIEHTQEQAKQSYEWFWRRLEGKVRARRQRNDEHH